MSEACRAQYYPDAMSGSPIDPRDLRVSDDERSHVLALLEKATGRGLIDIGEYTERSAKVISARTRGDLNAVLMDLPGLEIAGRSVDAAQRATATGAEPGPGFSGAVPRRGRPGVGAGVDRLGIADVQGLLDGAAADRHRRHRGQHPAGFHRRTTRLADRDGRVPVQLRRLRRVRGAAIGAPSGSTACRCAAATSTTRWNRAAVTTG